MNSDDFILLAAGWLVGIGMALILMGVFKLVG